MSSRERPHRPGSEPTRAVGEVVRLLGGARTALAAGDAGRAGSLTASLIVACDRMAAAGLAPPALGGEARAAAALLERDAAVLADKALARAERTARLLRHGPAPRGTRAA